MSKRADISRTSEQNEMRAAGSHNRKQNEEDGRVDDTRAALKGTRKKVELSGFAMYHLSAQSLSPLRQGHRLTDRQKDRHALAHKSDTEGEACLRLCIWWNQISRFDIHQLLHPAKESET